MLPLNKFQGALYGSKKREQHSSLCYTSGFPLKRMNVITNSCRSKKLNPGLPPHSWITKKPHLKGFKYLKRYKYHILNQNHCTFLMLWLQQNFSNSAACGTPFIKICGKHIKLTPQMWCRMINPCGAFPQNASKW